MRKLELAAGIIDRRLSYRKLVTKKTEMGQQ